MLGVILESGYVNKSRRADLPSNMQNSKIFTEFYQTGSGVPDSLVYEIVTRGKNHNLFLRFGTAIV